MPLEKLAAILSLTLLLLPFAASGIYKFKLDIGNPDSYCPEANYTCGLGYVHFLCRKPYRKTPNCICYKEMPLPSNMLVALLRSTNGIRNKVAIQYNIANMNILYWSNELMDMAQQFVLECELMVDPCLIIGDKRLRVSQNYALMKSEMTPRWPGRVVRHWYMEIGADIDDWSDMKQKILTGNLGNFTNMIYPLAEFMGCFGALYETGRFIVCYYYPAYNKSTFDKDFIIGDNVCRSCVAGRELCSKTFSGLCGRDFEIKISEATTPNLNIFVLIVFLLLCA